jgi:hypothetical protein
MKIYNVIRNYLDNGYDNDIDNIAYSSPTKAINFLLDSIFLLEDTVGKEEKLVLAEGTSDSFDDYLSSEIDNLIYHDISINITLIGEESGKVFQLFITCVELDYEPKELMESFK